MPYWNTAALGDRICFGVSPPERVRGTPEIDFGTRVVVTSTAEDSLKVAFGALFRDRDAWFVFRIADGIAEQCEVEPGPTNGSETEIKSGLSADDLVILHPTDKVRPGVKVRLTK